MDPWLIAATGYITKHLRNVSKGKQKFPEPSSEDLSLTSVKPEPPRCLVSGMVRDKKPNVENFEDCVKGENLDVFECGNVYGVEVASGNEEFRSDSFGNRAFLRRNQRYRSLVKPFSMGNSVMSRLHREKKMSMEEHMRSPYPSPCGSVSRPLVVTDGTKVISKNSGDCISQRVPSCGIPRLRKLESSGLYAKRRVGNVNGRSDNGIGSDDAALLLCFGISIGIMSSFLANQTEVNEVKPELKQTEDLVMDLEDELKAKDSLTVHDDFHKDDKQRDEKTAENSESISKIEAELEAELERLEINMDSSNIETRLSDAFELEPGFEVEFAQGELRDDLVERRGFDETESNQEPSGNATPESGNYRVSPRELSLRLHGVINSRYEKRIKELEIALQESQRKVEQLVMESEENRKPLSRIWEIQHKRDSNLPVSVAHIEKKQNPAENQPLVMNLVGPALDAFNDCYEELMDINDYSEEGDLPYEMQENERQEELSLTSRSSPWSHKDYIKVSSRTSEDVNFLRLQELLGLSDEEEEEEDREFESEMEKQLIKQIVEKTKQGSSAVFNAQKMLFLMEAIEQNP